MKRDLVKGLIIGALSTGILMGGTAMAATAYVQAIKGTSKVTINGQTISNPPKLVYGGTTYVQLYSIEGALKQTGITTGWDGNTFSMRTYTPGQEITFSNTSLQDDGLGDAQVIGIAKNNDTVSHSVNIIVSFYDDSGKLIGTQYAAVNDLGPGQTLPFTADSTISTSSVATFKVQIADLL